MKYKINSNGYIVNNSNLGSDNRFSQINITDGEMQYQNAVFMKYNETNKTLTVEVQVRKSNFANGGFDYTRVYTLA